MVKEGYSLTRPNPSQGNQNSSLGFRLQNLPLYSLASPLHSTHVIKRSIAQRIFLLFEASLSNIGQTMCSATQYRPPNVNTLLACGTTANIWRHSTRSKVVIKAPVACWWESSESRELQKKFSNETQILEILGEHRNIVRYEIDPPSPPHLA